VQVEVELVDWVAIETNQIEFGVSSFAVAEQVVENRTMASWDIVNLVEG
jgi:hypothetical protein